jgi:WD40 repeat protein
MKLLSRLAASVVALLLATCIAQAQAFDKVSLAWTLPWDADWVTAVAFVGPNRLAAGNNLGEILVWELPDKPGGPAPLPVRRLVGHTNVVNRLLAAPDGKTLLSASNDRTVGVWDLDSAPAEKETVVLNARAINEANEKKKKKAPAPNEASVLVQKPAQVLAGHRDWVLGMSLTADGKTLVTGDDKGEVIVWDRITGKEQRRWKLKGWAWAVAVEPEGKALLVSERVPLVFDSGSQSALKLWNPQTGELKVDLSKEIKERIGAAAYSPDGKWLAIGRGGELDGNNGKVILLDPATGKKIREMTPGHLNGLTDIVFHPDGQHVLSAGRDTTVKIWRLDDGKLVKELGQPRGGQFKDWFHAVAVSPDRRWIAAADMAGQVQLWAVP